MLALSNIFPFPYFNYSRFVEIGVKARPGLDMFQDCGTEMFTQNEDVSKKSLSDKVFYDTSNYEANQNDQNWQK